MKETKNNIKLGIFITIGTVLFILALYYLGSKQNLFGSTFEIKATFNNVNGLRKGNNVRFSGIDAGTVKDIIIVNDTTIEVLMILDESIQPFIKTDAVATLGNDGLMGSKLINISPGNPSSQAIQEGETLVSINELDADEMLRRLEQTNRNISTITESFVSIAQKIDVGDGAIGMLLNDSNLSKDISMTMQNIRILSNETAKLSQTLGSSFDKLESNDNTLGILLNDTAMASDIQYAVKELRIFSSNSEQITAELKEIVDKIQSGDGTVGTLLSDSLSNESMKQTLINLQDGSKAFYENMEALKSNFLFRRYFKNQEKKK
ncbi:MAG: MCE family protein [Bacteroidetes bacterium]|nr:MAG: MCE family protein [Bacteroidota bacterium]MBL1144957.1 MCE family protein [Bacteroidota bacterium]MCB0802165.1 MCE family protein [Flavobacteriales bacterium]NOG57751.1 MCE family protein [Bacteroidota bacterium]